MPSSTHPLPALSAIPDLCHPERSRAVSEAHRQTQSKDPYELVLPAMEQFSPVRQDNAITPTYDDLIEQA
jgi:hypothetical protein